MDRFLSWSGTLLILSLLVGVPSLYAKQSSAATRNLHTVQPGVLYRSAQLSPKGLQRVLRDFGIKTVITLRESFTDDKPNDLAEQKLCAKHGVHFVRLPARRWERVAGVSPADENIAKFLSIVQDPAQQPVLIHCFAGIHRTGAHCAIYRMEAQGWDNATAIHEMKSLGYKNIHAEPDILTYLQSYQPRGKRD